MSETEQTTYENVLFSRDIIEKIFSNLNVKDLRRAAGVCWYWHEMAKKELSNRCTIESLILPLYITPYNHGYCLHVSEEFDGFFECYNKVRLGPSEKKEEELDLADAAWHVSEAVRCVPKVLLVFCDDYVETEYPFYMEYTDSLPKYALFAEVAFMKMTVDGTDIYAQTNLGSGISIPSTSNLKSKMLSIEKDDGYFDEDDFHDDWEGDLMTCCVRDILNKLDVLATTEEHSCFILFLNRWINTEETLVNSIWKYESYVNEFLKNLKKRFKPGTYSVFATGCSFMSTSLNNDPWLACNFTYFLRIYGSELKSWSVVISMNLPEEEMENKLCEVKKKIIVNSTTIALCAIPVNEENLRRDICGIEDDEEVSEVTYFDPTTLFKQVFPSITLTCVYDNEDYFQFGCNTLDKESDPVFKHRRSMIFLFITTN